MNKFMLLLVLLPSVCLCEGPLFNNKDTFTQQEFDNVYQDLRKNNFTQYINVKSYGATGDGKTDDATSIQTALNVSSGSPTKIYFPNGTYVIGTRLVFPSSITIEGASLGSVILKAKNGMNDRLIVNSGYALTQPWTYSLRFENIVFDLNGVNQTNSDAPSFERDDDMQFINCRFINAYDTLLLITGNPTPNLNNNVLIDKCFFDGTNQQQATDVFDVGDGSNVVVTNSFFFSSKGGNQGMLEPSVINHLVIKNCYFDGNGNGTPIEMKGINGGEFSSNEVKNSAGEGVGLWAWHESSPFFVSRDFVISNNNIHDNVGQGILMVAPGGSSDTAYNLSISNNSIHDNQNEGLKTQTVHGITVSNNFIYNNSKASAGTYAALNFNGAFVQDDVSNVRVSGNTFYDSQASPTQTFLYNVNNVSTMTMHNNFYRQITTKITQSNSTLVNFLDKTKEELNSVVGNFTRDISLSSGNQSITGVGFTPNTVNLLSSIDGGGAHSSFGSDDASAHTAFTISGTSINYWGSDSIVYYDGAGTNYTTAHIISMDADGFTVAWTKIGSPTGTYHVIYTANR